MEPDTAESKLREVARRPARGSLGNFFGDLGTFSATRRSRRP